MDATPAFRYLLNPGQEELTEVDKMILNCAAEAKLSKDQWDEMLKKVGAEKIEDLLELLSVDYESCDFKPLLRRRLVNFQKAIYANHWSKQEEEEEEEEDVTARGSGDAEEAAPAAPSAPRPPAPAAPPGTENLCPCHKPPKKRQGDLKYWYFNAVSQGCKKCVLILVHQMGVDKDATSDNRGYDAMDFAEYFKQPAMRAFLETL